MRRDQVALDVGGGEKVAFERWFDDGDDDGTEIVALLGVLQTRASSG
jgi:hypothetical protein